MATYSQWNKAVVRYFTLNLPRGASVFLTLNDDALREIAADFLEGAVALENAVADFAATVRSQVVDRNSVSLATLTGPSQEGFPGGVGFLGLMVLAAHRMAGDHETDATNYFLRLTEQLGVPTRQGNRPAGLGVGEEEILWIQWNQWLQKNGWQPTARHGPDGTRKYLNYVLTQALVRDDDRTYLQHIFTQNRGAGGINPNMDEVQLAGWLQRANVITRRYLREGFRNTEPRRAAAFYEAAYRVFETTAWEGGPQPPNTQRLRIINAGLFRSVTLSGQITYRMFVPQPTHWIPKPLTLHFTDAPPMRLNPGRPGHFQPLGPHPPFPPESIRLQLEGDSQLDAVVFPKRDFWILTTDPEDTTSAFATWEKFPNLLGQKFTLLASAEGKSFVHDEMIKFRDAKLLNWDGEPHLTSNMAIYEYRGCMILSSAWDGIVPSDQCGGLFEALKPKQFATISLSGGIRAPGQNAWLVGNPPKAILYGFEEEFGLRLLSGEDEKLSCRHKRQQPLELDSCLPAGIYTFEADWNGQLLATRSFRLVTWEEMELAPSTVEDGPTIISNSSSLLISGAVLEEEASAKVVNNV